MNRVSESKLNMYDAVITYCNANTATVTSLVPFQTAVTALQTIVAQIRNTVQMQAGVISGIAMDKKQLRLALCAQAADLCAITFSYAATTNNNQLKEQVNFSPSGLGRLSDEKLVPTCANIQDVLNANAAALTAYGITADAITGFQSAMDVYQAKIASPRNAISQRTAHSAALINLFKEANTILRNQMDKVAVKFKTINEDFYNAYKSNRVIVGPGTVVVAKS